MSLDYQKTPAPPFGHPMLEYFPFDKEVKIMNHGSYGSLPVPVLEKCTALAAQAEANPDMWNRVTYLPLLTRVRERVAALLGAQTDECVMVANASAGVSTVLRNIEWAKGDVIVTFRSTYGAVERAVQYICDSPPHPTVTVVPLVFPTTPEAVVAQFRAHLKAIPRVPGQTVLAIIDALVSLPGVLLPWEEMVKVCKEEGVLSLVDGAHAIGQVVGIDLSKIEPDFFISNCHKWLYAKRGCAVLYVPLRNQHLVKSSFPTSHAYISPANRTTPNFVEQFDWTATIDLVPFVSVGPALDFRQWLGGEAKINEYCHQLVMDGAARVAEILGTSVLDPTGDMTGNMVTPPMPGYDFAHKHSGADQTPFSQANVKIPLPDDLDAKATMDKMREKTLVQRKIYVPSFFLPETGWWIRVCAQVWNEMSDFELLGRVLLEVCSETEREIKAA
ncbi:unnamed protein product [Mycena citricolor]|uniref:Aminotransferase class V domain-containing protein n=1 Tax=Mycena citricolor TaxID=2018698 RepID=A0AAD2K7C4_9AGAR|nr:unnamed protein product [Mycena citricolor]